MVNKKKISIVIPVFCESENLLLLCDRLEAVTSKMPEYEWEYMYVNDGSTDDSLKVLLDMSDRNERIKILDLSRNFGKEIALTAGTHEAVRSDAVICIDSDLQHPPELIPALVKEWEAGVEIVATIRTTTQKESLFRRFASHSYYWLMSKISGLDMVSQTTDFRLYDQKVIQVFELATERDRMFRGIMDWMGFRKTYIEFEADSRNSGRANYSYLKLWQLAISSITSFSLWPLRLTGYLGVFITAGSGLLLIWMSLNFLFGSEVIYSALAIVVVANTFLIGIVLMAIGLVALYIGSIHTEVINRPLYIVREKVNISQ